MTAPEEGRWLLGVAMKATSSGGPGRWQEGHQGRPLKQVVCVFPGKQLERSKEWPCGKKSETRMTEYGQADVTGSGSPGGSVTAGS